ncbi:DUF3455 domain-containing protein [Pseudorhodoferax sp.]|uniref:DUF3455 domain-containing protein n=1 Tax=Pseudorhodoferax sp. TaxID=1993553 RepID=UPI002DD677C2|nr:DUF3455 domain-containing protein [Pseudorhodoferax sp.]
MFQRGVLAAGLAATLAGCASRPSAIDVPAAEKLLMTVAALGVQTYECRATAGGAPAWTFVAPQAELFDSAGRRIGQHRAGPSWQHEDGSGFTGTVRARMDAPQPGAIPWLLLAAQPQGPAGVFSRVRHVQRVDTVAGQAPADGCSAAALGTRVHMAYRANYRLTAP